MKRASKHKGAKTTKHSSDIPNVLSPSKNNIKKNEQPSSKKRPTTTLSDEWDSDFETKAELRKKTQKRKKKIEKNRQSELMSPIRNTLYLNDSGINVTDESTLEPSEDTNKERDAAFNIALEKFRQIEDDIAIEDANADNNAVVEVVESQSNVDDKKKKRHNGKAAMSKENDGQSPYTEILYRKLSKFDSPNPYGQHIEDQTRFQTLQYKNELHQPNTLDISNDDITPSFFQKPSAQSYEDSDSDEEYCPLIENKEYYSYSTSGIGDSDNDADEDIHEADENDYDLEKDAISETEEENDDHLLHPTLNTTNDHPVNTRPDTKKLKVSNYRWKFVDPKSTEVFYKRRVICLEDNNGSPCNQNISLGAIVRHNKLVHISIKLPRLQSTYNWEFIDTDNSKEYRKRRVRCLEIGPNGPCHSEVSYRAIFRHNRLVHKKKRHHNFRTYANFKWEFVSDKDSSVVLRKRRVRCLEVDQKGLCGKEILHKNLQCHNDAFHNNNEQETVLRSINGKWKKYKSELVNPFDLPVNGVTYDPMIKCLEDLPDGNVCNREMRNSKISQHNLRHHNGTPGFKKYNTKRITLILKNYKVELLDPTYRPAQNVKYNPRVRCIEDVKEGKCNMELYADDVGDHMMQFHKQHKHDQSRRHLQLETAKLHSDQSIKGKITYWQRLREYEHTPTTFNVLQHHEEPPSDMSSLIIEMTEFNRLQYENKDVELYKPYHGTIIALFKPRHVDDKDMTLYQMMAKYEHDDSYHVFLFYDTSSDIGPCRTTHVEKDATSSVRQMVELEGYSMYIVRIQFKGDTSINNFKNAMDWQNFYTILSHLKLVFGKNAPGIKINMLNKYEVQKSNYRSVLSPSEFQRALNIAIHGTQFFFPVSGYEDLPWIPYTFPTKSFMNSNK